MSGLLNVIGNTVLGIAPSKVACVVPFIIPLGHLRISIALRNCLSDL